MKVEAKGAASSISRSRGEGAGTAVDGTAVRSRRGRAGTSRAHGPDRGREVRSEIGSRVGVIGPAGTSPASATQGGVDVRPRAAQSEHLSPRRAGRGSDFMPAAGGQSGWSGSRRIYPRSTKSVLSRPVSRSLSPGPSPASTSRPRHDRVVALGGLEIQAHGDDDHRHARGAAAAAGSGTPSRCGACASRACRPRTRAAPRRRARADSP